MASQEEKKSTPASGDEEKKLVVEAWKKPIAAGDTWYVVSRKWWSKWCDYSGFQQEKAGGPRPGPIDNSDLFDGKSPNNLEMKREIVGSDYVVMNTFVYKIIESWYGGGPTIPRAVQEYGQTKELRVELFPLFMNLYSPDEKSGEPVLKQANYCFAGVLTLNHYLDKLAPAYRKDFLEKPENAKKPFSRVWVKLDKSTFKDDTDELLAEAAQKEKAEAQEKASKAGAEAAPQGPVWVWKLFHCEYYKDKIENVELKTGMDIMIEFRKPDGTWARQISKPNWKEFAIGDMLDCADHRGVYFESILRDVKETKLFVHFVNWSTRWDEWIPKDSPRLAPRSEYTIGPYMPKEDGPSGARLHTEGASDEVGAVGLRNLGNTCFMNSTLQCLSNTAVLSEYFREGKFKDEINVSNPLGWGGKIALEYAKLIKEIWSGKYQVVAPRALKDAIGEYQPRFSGYQQHDSSELLSFLLDGLHEDLNRVKKKPPTQPVESGGRPDLVVARESWERHLMRNQSVIVDTCQGQLKSRVVCPKCNRESITFDPFMFLSLPLPDSNDTTLPVTLVPANGAPPKVYRVKCNKFGEMNELRDKVAKMSGANAAHFICAEIWNNRLFKIYAPDYPLSRLGPQDAIWVYESHAPQGSFQAQLCHFVGQGRRVNMIGAPSIVVLQESKLGAFPNKELHDICKKAVAPFLKGGRWNDGEEVPYKLYLADKSGRDIRCEIPNDDKATDLNQGGGFSVCCVWPAFDRMEEKFSADGATGEGKKGLDLKDCFDSFSTEEILQKSEAWYCSKCRDHFQASKKMDVWMLPDVLLIHLKRFSYANNIFRDKITHFVDFPIQGLDVKPWCVNPEEKNTVYDLFAVSNHFGNLGGGHYTAFAQNSRNKKWYNFDDSHVEPLDDVNKVKTAAAYVLFYKRRVPTNVRYSLPLPLPAAAAADSKKPEAPAADSKKPEVPAAAASSAASPSQVPNAPAPASSAAPDPK